MEPHIFGHHFKKIELVHKHFKVSLIFVLLTLFLFVLSIWFVVGRYEKALMQNAIKIENIYQEIGKVKEENEMLNTTLQGAIAEIDSIYIGLDQLVKANGGEGVTISETSFKRMIESAEKSGVSKKVNTEDSVSLLYPEEVVNVLLVGTHSKLTDTIMVASINPNKETVSLVSLPRDLYIAGRRINEIYFAYGIKSLQKEITEITGLEIDYYAIVDLKSFVQTVDLLGGITVDVQKAIYDYQYPTADKGYQVFSLDSGVQTLDGETALKYARSRKSTNDFDRAKRQQQVIKALKDAVLKKNILGLQKEGVNLYNSIKSNVHTDIDVFSALNLLKEAQNYEIETGNVIDNTNYLYSTISLGGAYILLPNDKSFDEIKAFVYKLVVN